jgi:hypothetical protein
MCPDKELRLLFFISKEMKLPLHKEQIKAHIFASLSADGVAL